MCRLNHKFTTKQTARILQQHGIDPYNEDTDSLIDLLKPNVNSRRRWEQRDVDECSGDNEDDEEEDMEIEEYNDDYGDEDDDDTASNVSDKRG